MEAAFSGDGAKLFCGRWNPPGYPAIYTAESLSLAILEMIVHLDEDEDIQSYVAVSVRFENVHITSWTEEKLPKGWACLPISEQTQEMGKVWIKEKQSLILKVPSSVVRHDCNFIINPMHPDFHRLKIGQPEALKTDPRLSDRLQ